MKIIIYRDNKEELLIIQKEDNIFEYLLLHSV